MKLDVQVLIQNEHILRLHQLIRDPCADRLKSALESRNLKTFDYDEFKIIQRIGRGDLVRFILLIVRF